MDQILGEVLGVAPLVAKYAIGAAAGSVATFLTAWFTKASDRITEFSNDAQGHPVTAALAYVGTEGWKATSDRKITKDEVIAVTEGALKKLGLEL